MTVATSTCACAKVIQTLYTTCVLSYGFQHFTKVKKSGGRMWVAIYSGLGILWGHNFIIFINFLFTRHNRHKSTQNNHTELATCNLSEEGNQTLSIAGEGRQRCAFFGVFHTNCWRWSLWKSTSPTRLILLRVYTSSTEFVHDRACHWCFYRQEP